MAFKMKGFNPGKGTGMGSSMDMKKNSAMDMKRGSAMDMRSKSSPNKEIGVKMGGKFYPGIRDTSSDSPQKLASLLYRGYKAVKTVGKAAKKVKVKKPTTTSTTSKTTVPSTVVDKSSKVKIPTVKLDKANFLKQPGMTEAKWKKYSKMIAKGVAGDVALSYVLGGTYKDSLTANILSGIKNILFPSKEDNTAIQDAAKDSETAGGTSGSKKDPYAEAKKRDPNLDKYIAERDKHKKGSDAYNAAQNKINRAYGVKKRHGVTNVTTTKGRDTVSRKKVPGIVEKARLVRERKIGGTKQIDQVKSLITGKSKERKRKEGKEKERFYDAEGNLTRKTKDKRGKQKDIRKTANTVTKIKINKRTGKVKTKTRKRRGQKTGEFLASLVGK
tara:strand:- start:46 stop:1203 length:1158 start_codon:yes stop_codon:yes gene_type:complete